MPFYDYLCQQCGLVFSHFYSYVEYGRQIPNCPKCHAQSTQRKIGKVRVARSLETRLEEYETAGVPESLDGLEENPQALGKMMRKMSGELDEAMNPEFNEIVERLEKGQAPEEIERELPDVNDGTETSGDQL